MTKYRVYTPNGYIEFLDEPTPEKYAEISGVGEVEKIEFELPIIVEQEN